MKTYTTKQGDTWDSVAYSQMGSCAHLDELMWKNRAYLALYLFPAGLILNIPEPEAVISDSLPPWKQVAG